MLRVHSLQNGSRVWWAVWTDLDDLDWEARVISRTLAKAKEAFARSLLVRGCAPQRTLYGLVREVDVIECRGYTDIRVYGGCYPVPGALVWEELRLSRMGDHTVMEWVTNPRSLFLDFVDLSDRRPLNPVTTGEDDVFPHDKTGE